MTVGQSLIIVNGETTTPRNCFGVELLCWGLSGGFYGGCLQASVGLDMSRALGTIDQGMFEARKGLDET